MRCYIPSFIDSIKAAPRLPLVYLIPALTLCLLLQLQVSLFKTEDYLGLRFSAADLLLPFLGLFISFRLLRRRDRLPRWRIKGFYFWLAAFAAVMTYALLNGYQTIGAWDRWAVINKYAGFFVLLAYLGVGGWIGSRPVGEWHRCITPSFIIVWGTILIGTLGSILWFDIQQNMSYILDRYPLSAFMGNRNAFAFLSFCTLALLTTTQLKSERPASPFLYLLWGLMPLFYIYNASRVGIIILPLLLCVALFLNPRMTIKAILPALLTGALLLYSLSGVISPYVKDTTLWHAGSAGALVKTGLSERNLTPEIAAEKLDYIGDQVRAKTYNDALSVWAQHKLTGGGIGSYRYYQMETRGQYSDIVDSTPLWLLAETGFIGLALFAGLFLMALWRIFAKVKSGQDPYGVYLGIFLMLMIFALMSLVHELLYTRFVWFFMGLALALPPEERKAA